MVVEEKQGPILQSLRGLHHAHIVRFCSVVLCPPPCACPQSGLYTALHGILRHLVEGEKDKEGPITIDKHSQMGIVVHKSTSKIGLNGAGARLGDQPAVAKLEDYNVM